MFSYPSYLMKIKVGLSDIELTRNHFLASGGQGDIYKYHDSIYKIYHDADKIILPQKLKELKSLDRENIICPIDYIYQQSKLCGIYFRYADGVPLVQYGTNTHIKTNNTQPTHLYDILERMVETLEFIHSQQCLIVDINEYNFLMNVGNVYFIDVDNYQTPTFPCIAVSPSIRDPLTDAFTEDTDWYGYGIISCMLLTGVYPFKGKHILADISERKKQGIWLMSTGVSVNSAVRLSWIPKNYVEWYHELFHGTRCKPPSMTGTIPIFTYKISIMNGNIQFKLLHEHTHPIHHHILVKNTHRFDSLSSTSFWVNDYHYQLNHGKLESMVDLYGKEFVKTSWDILPLSTKVYDGFCVSDVIGHCYFLIPDGYACYTVPVPELNGASILEAKRDRNVIWVRYNDKQHQDVSVMIVFDKKFRSHHKHTMPDVDINFCILDTNIGLRIVEDESIEIFKASGHTIEVKKIMDTSILSTMKLTSLRLHAGITIDNKLYQISLS